MPGQEQEVGRGQVLPAPDPGVSGRSRPRLGAVRPGARGVRPPPWAAGPPPGPAAPRSGPSPPFTWDRGPHAWDGRPRAGGISPRSGGAGQGPGPTAPNVGANGFCARGKGGRKRRHRGGLDGKRAEDRGNTTRGWALGGSVGSAGGASGHRENPSAGVGEVSPGGLRNLAPQGAKACSLGRQPQVAGSQAIQSPEGATEVFLEAGLPSPLRGSGSRSVSPSWG